MTNTLIIGASAAGLSCAAHLKKKNIAYRLVEKQPHVAHAWRNHYHRLHLHTHKASSGLPFLPYPKEAMKYPSREQVVNYLDHYCDQLDLQPEFNTEVTAIVPTEKGWLAKTSNGDIETLHIIFCCGNTNIAHRVKKEGIETFPGEILHSSEYKNGEPFRNKSVLVIGFGNSACEIAICLHEHGASPALSVRGEVNVIPRDILGIPVLQIGILQSGIPPRLADNLNKPLLNLLIGDITKLGLKKAPYGPIEQIVKHHKIPLLNIGTVELIRSGDIKVYWDIEKIDGDVVHFENGKSHRFDAIVMATGYETGIESMIDLTEVRLMDIHQNIKHRKYMGKDGLYFCGYYVSPTGMLREINIESGIIANHLEKTN